MFDREPRESSVFSWGLVFTWMALILLTSPLVRMGTIYVKSRWGSEIFIYAVASFMICMAVLTLAYLVRRGGMSARRYGWLAASLAAMMALIFTGHSGTPAEVIHYFEYGILSLLIYRALANHIRDHSIYGAVVLIGTLLGILDETVQWIIPGRYFDFADVWLNFTAVAVVQFAIATAIRPGMIADRFEVGSLRRLCRLGALIVGALCLCHLNTPQAILAYSAFVPGSDFVVRNGSVMTEYGHRYDQGGVLTFKSRFTADEVRRLATELTDASLGQLETFPDHGAYRSFLEKHTVFNAPLLHEVGIHVRRRDQYLAWARETKSEAAETTRYTAAHRENQVLTTHFAAVLQASDVRWTPETIAEVEARSDPRKPYASRVSNHLITFYSWKLALWVSLAGITLLLGMGEAARLHERRTGSA